MSKIFHYIPAAYKVGLTYTAIPSNTLQEMVDASFTFARPAAADRTDEEGATESMAINVPRIDYAEDGCPLLLLDTSLSETAGDADVVADIDSIVWSVEAKQTVNDISMIALYNSTNDALRIEYNVNGTIRASIVDGGIILGQIDYVNNDTTLLKNISLMKSQDVAELKIDGVYVGVLDSLALLGNSENMNYDDGSGLFDFNGKTRNNTIDDDVASFNSTATSYVELDTQINNFTTR